MASLTHVCMWSDNNWKHITAEEAAQLHPGGTVSANSGLFMCELCGQYVTLVDGDRMVRHFRHSAAEKSKDCPERTFGAGYVVYYKSNEYDLPLRLVNISPTDFRLELGLISIPDELISSSMRITGSFPNVTNNHFTYSGERLNQGGITYLNVGDIPHEAYKIMVTGCDNKIYRFWPRVVDGVDPQGTLFEKSTGKKLGTDADVVVGQPYDRLTRGISEKKAKHIKVEEICRKTISWNTWRVYQVEALDYDEKTARFFLDYHCRLTEHPIEIHPIWPVSVQNPYVVKHCDNRLTIYFKGNATAHVFPETRVTAFHNSTVREVICNSRQQLISLGRARALQYTYFWKDDLIYPTAAPKLVITDISGNNVNPGEQNQLPPGRRIRITAGFDGCVVVKNGTRTINKRKLRANTSTELDELSYGLSVSIIVGCDCLAEISFTKRKAKIAANDEAVFAELLNSGGRTIPVSHTIGALAMQLTDYPKVRSWLYGCIRNGSMNESAYRKLQHLVLESQNAIKEENR